MGTWVCYLLECADGTLYCGITNDINKRLAAHNAGTGAKYTRSRTPVSLRYQESFDDRSSASKREAELKRLGRSRKLALIALLAPTKEDAMLQSPKNKTGHDLT